ncbi:MAG: PAS domain-containing protein [Spirochaetaceae bacterium]
MVKKEKNIDNQFYVVGIGASAGGLEALEAFFSKMPSDSGIACVVVSHLDPSHNSILPEIIQKKTKMQVLQVKDHMIVKPNHVYIIPPDKEMSILNGVLQLLKMTKPHGANLPIDIFFRSLAMDKGSMAISIILSGTGTDGTQGIRAVKAELGMVMVQSAESAKYDGMPRSAIATKLADYILSPEDMPNQLLKYVKYKMNKQTLEFNSDDSKYEHAMQKIFLLLRTSTKHDFSFYKKNTITRRIARRMQVHQMEDINGYIQYLQESEREIHILFKELLIGVTSFFRDPEAFDLLKNKFIPEYLADKPEHYQIRVWVPGCSSGEEVYTIAIIFQEYMELVERHFSVQIFGTDLDEEAIKRARTGIYPVSISEDISKVRLSKFFTHEENHYRINQNIREMVIFAPQNLIKDPPFTKLDLLSCRNLLIYFGAELQKKLFPIFNYSLNHDGILFLGSSETIGQSSKLFSILDKKWKIFKKSSSNRVGFPIIDLPTFGTSSIITQKEVSEPLKPLKEVDTLKLLKAILSKSELPTCVVINDLADIIYIHGRIGKFLEPAEGETSINILEMARPGLKAGLISGIKKMATSRQEVIIKGLEVQDYTGFVDVTLIVRPLPNFSTHSRGLMLIIFDEGSHHKKEKNSVFVEEHSIIKGNDVKRLEDELLYTKENLQTTIEELETSNEELKSTNEELQSTNEELQSTNEELETSKEELQSLNEESTTVNTELQFRIDELVEANDDIKNLLDTTEIATIFLDINLNIRRYTPKVTDFFHLTSADIGRPIEHFATTLKNVKLVECAKIVLRDLGHNESEVIDNKGGVYEMRIRPYRTTNNVIDGVVVTFQNISNYKNALLKLSENEVMWNYLSEQTTDIVYIITNNVFSYVNIQAKKSFGKPANSLLIGKCAINLIPKQIKELEYNKTGSIIVIDDDNSKTFVTSLIFNNIESFLVTSRSND